jgi:FkbM family methyltransferase
MASNAMSCEHQDERLDDVLRRVQELGRREREIFDELTRPFGARIVLYGAGNLGRKTLAGLRQVGVVPLAFADGNPSLWGKRVDGLPVLPPEEAAHAYGASAVFVVTVWSPGNDRRFTTVKEGLTALGCTCVVWFVSLFWKYSEIFLPHYRINLPHRISDAAPGLRHVYEFWADDTSRREFLSQLEWLVSLEGGLNELPPAAPPPTYLPNDLFRLGPDDTFVDCGAYDGDTIRSFLAQHPTGFRSVLAFEPDPGTFDVLVRQIGLLPSLLRDRIILRRAALGSRSGLVRFEAQGSVGSAIRETGDVEVECVVLDDVLSEFQPTYIKMDIEGSEMDALRGSRQTIERCAPLMAVCVYHLQEHLWEIPLFVQSLSERYCHFLRRYVDEFGDLVFYAVPRDRVLPPVGAWKGAELQ